MATSIAFQLLLAVHIVAGAGAFLIAPIALATAKGGRQHKRWGMVYLWSMGIMAATAIPLAFVRPVLFLALVAVFSFYLAFSGYRVLRLKELARGGSARAVDWLAGIVTVAASLGLVVLSLFRPASIQVISPVGVAFGLIGVLASAGQLWRFVRKPTDKLFWWNAHLTGFLGSYIAAWSAFSAITLIRVLGNHWYVWLWPTIVGVPATVAMAGYYRRRFAGRPSTLAG